MKARMILAALVACAVVMAMQAPASAVLITDTYLIGNKDDFDNVDGDGTLDGSDGDLVTNDVIVEGSGPGQLKFWDMPLPDPEAGNTDTQMKAASGWPIFDLEFNVATHPDPLTSGTLRLATWGVGYNAPGTWDKQPINVSTTGGDADLLPMALAGKTLVWINDIPLTPAALALIAAGGEVHITIGSQATFTSTDVMVLDYAQLDLTYDDGHGGGDPVPEASSAMLLVTGLAGLTARRRRRK